MKNAIYFTSKSIFFLKILVLTFWWCRKTVWLERLISKFVTSQPETPIISIHILPNISRSKGNQTIKFNQLIEYYRRNILLEKPYTKCSGAWSGETIPIRFSKKSKLSISLDQMLQFFDTWRYQSLVRLFFSSIMILI